MLWYSLEAPCRGASNEYHNICFREEIRKIPAFFRMKKAPYLLLCVMNGKQVDPDETACYKAFHLDPHCVHRCLFWSAGLKGLILYYT